MPFFSDRYELLRVLGRGGMGEVHLARDIKFDRLVALKFFREDPHDGGARSRFLREATLAGRLIDPHVVTIYDFGEHDSELYIAMEYIAGDSVAQLIRRREPESLRERVRLAIDLCAGLAAAHDAGLLHRDIKPENLMIGPNGRLKIVDFGIARALESPRTVTLLGSLHYMSPEQLTQSPLDARSDIFAVGAVLYELLTFAQAFPVENLDGLVRQIRFGSPLPLADCCPGAPPRLIAVVERALEKAPEDRFPDCRAMARELAAVLRELPIDDDDESPAAAPETDLRPLVVQASTRAIPPLKGWWARAQARILNAGASLDYVWLAAIGGAPLLVSMAIGASDDRILHPASPAYQACVAAFGPNPTVAGFATRLNWWPSFIYLPLALFVVRRTALQLYPATTPGGAAHTGIVRRVPASGRPAVAADLAAVAVDARNLQAVIGLIAVLTALDLREIVSHYAAAAGGSVPACPRELDWTVMFVTGVVSMPANTLLLVLAYSAQVVLHGLGLMLLLLLFRHNLFYLNRIYQRHRSHRYPIDEHVVLEFDDVERCFGLRVLHVTFNYQILVLLIGGSLILGSRLMNVDRTPFSVQYEAALSVLLPGDDATPRPRLAGLTLGDLFPDIGQVMLAVAWVVCFLVVAMPSLVKFLPLAEKRVRLIGRREYLLEFIPPTTSVPTGTPEEVDRLAQKFARSSFWPAGDERARSLYWIAHFVFFMMVVPLPPTSRPAQALHVGAVLLISFVTMKVTFWLFRKILMNIDATLA